MTSKLETHFVRPLTEFYKANPFGSGFAKRLEPYAATLSEEVLEAVATKIIETGGKTFPSLVTCRNALMNAETALTTPVSTEPRPWEHQKRDKFDWEARLVGIKLCRCSMGRQADGEGWLPALIEFCQDNGRLPNEREIHGVKATARRSEDALEATKGSALYSNLVTFRRNMIERAHKDVFGFVEGSHEQEAA